MIEIVYSHSQQMYNHIFLFRMLGLHTVKHRHWYHSGNKEGMELAELLECHNLHQHVVAPTHTKGHTIDLIISRSDDNILR